MNHFWGADADPTAQGRIKGAQPVAVLDIGSNSVRLVVYERHARALTPLYNEKSSCSLGRGVAATGRMADENVRRALTAIQRFALVARLMRAGEVHILATSAVREAENRESFVAAVEEMMGAPVTVLSGAEEAHFAALGVISGSPGFTGVVGDLGGGSLELSSLLEGADRTGETFELGVIRLQDDTGGAPDKAPALVRERIAAATFSLDGTVPTTFCAIGGTWRTLATIHLSLRGYPLHMVQHYQVPAEDMIGLCAEIVAAAAAGKTYPGAEHASSSRRDLVPYGAAVLGEVLKAGGFAQVTFSALGVREGFLYGLLDDEEQSVDPLIQGADELCVLRSRSPAHAQDLIAFTDAFFAAAQIIESSEEQRLRRVACLVSDIGWRAHPDYRAAQSIDVVAYGTLTGIDHPGRAFLSEILAVRYAGLKHKGVDVPVLALSRGIQSARARLIGALFRVAYPMTAAMPGVLPRVRFRAEGLVIVLELPADLVFLDGEHLRQRLEQFAGTTMFTSSRIEVDAG